MSRDLLSGVLLHWGSVVKHKAWVAYYLFAYWINPATSAHDPALLWRAVIHDLSKFRWDETKGFATTVHRLAAVTYGSAEYKALVQQIMPSISLHYERNSHHPEHYTQGFHAMNDLDVIEMVADWCAARRRHSNGDFDQSLEVNTSRFGLDQEDVARIRGIAKLMGGA